MNRKNNLQLIMLLCCFISFSCPVFAMGDNPRQQPGDINTSSCDSSVLQTESFRAAELAARALRAAFKGNYSAARQGLTLAACRGDEFAIRYLAHGYTHGGIITDIDLPLANHFINLRRQLPATESLFLMSLINIANGRLERDYFTKHRWYEELIRPCKAIHPTNQGCRCRCEYPQTGLPKLIEKYLSSNEIDQYWESLKSAIIELNSQAVYRSIITIFDRFQTSQDRWFFSNKEVNVLMLVKKYK